MSEAEHSGLEGAQAPGGAPAARDARRLRWISRRVDMGRRDRPRRGNQPAWGAPDGAPLPADSGRGRRAAGQAPPVAADGRRRGGPALAPRVGARAPVGPDRAPGPGVDSLRVQDLRARGSAWAGADRALERRDPPRPLAPLERGALGSRSTGRQGGRGADRGRSSGGLPLDFDKVFLDGYRAREYGVVRRIDDEAAPSSSPPAGGVIGFAPRRGRGSQWPGPINRQSVRRGAHGTGPGSQVQPSAERDHAERDRGPDAGGVGGRRRGV